MNSLICDICGGADRAKIIRAGTILDGELAGWIFGEYDVALSVDSDTHEVKYGGYTTSQLALMAKGEFDQADGNYALGGRVVVGETYDENDRPLPPRVVFINADSYCEMTTAPVVHEVNNANL